MAHNNSYSSDSDSDSDSEIKTEPPEMASAALLQQPPDTRVSSSAWIPELKQELKSAPLTEADPSIFEDADEGDVRVPSSREASIDLPKAANSKMSSHAALLLATRMPSMGGSATTPSDWLQTKVLSGSLLNSFPSQQRSSSIELLSRLGLLEKPPVAPVASTERVVLNQIGASGPAGQEMHSTESNNSTEALLREQLGLTKASAPLPSASPGPAAGGDKHHEEVPDNEIREWDVLCGRGGKSNHHPGNKRYRQVVSEMKNKYRGTSAKTDKTALSRAIVDYVNGYGGRFLKKDSKSKKYFMLTKSEARKKTSQALRETKELKWTL